MLERLVAFNFTSVTDAKEALPFVTEEAEEGLVLQAMLVLFPTVEMPLNIELGERVDSEGPFRVIIGDDGLDSLL